MEFFKHSEVTRVITDASPVGQGAILEQQQPDGQYISVNYASRKLNKVESRYSQFERETIGVKWACEKFFLYLSGNKFEIQTDHKPLLKLLSPNSKPPSARIEKWILYLQQFFYTVKHVSGKDNHAEILSRLLPQQFQPQRKQKESQQLTKLYR